MDHAPSLITVEHSDALFALHVKPADLPRFYGYQERNQERVRMLLCILPLIEQAPCLASGYQRGAAALKGSLDLSADTLRRVYSKWRKEGKDWRALLDMALENKPVAPTPPEFLAELQLRADAHHRSIAGALKLLRADFAAGKPIPGYGTWQEWWMRTHPTRTLPKHFNGVYPVGFHPRTLRRKLDPSKFRRIAQTRGMTAAKKHRPGMKLSRVGSAPGKEMMWDDAQHNMFVNSFQHKQAGRPLELFAHDYAAAYKTFNGIKPMYQDDAGTMKKLSGDMMRLVVAGHFWTHGYHPEGTINYAEHGTANFADDVCKALYDDTDGLITVSESGFDGRAPHAGLYHGRWKGQPGFKASLESSNNLVQNMEGGIEGQTGRNVEERVEHLHGTLTHNAQLLEAWAWLPVEFRDMLDFPLMEITAFQKRMNEVYHYIACERDHDLEGWIEAGNVMQMIEFAGHFMTLEDIKSKPPKVQQQALALLSAGLLQAKPVKMTRAEVWQRGKAALIPIHGGTVCRILGPSFAREVRVNGHEIVFECAEYGPEPLAFFGSVLTPDGYHDELTEGNGYEVFVNPFAPHELFVRDAKGRYLGTAKRQPRAPRLNREAVTSAVREYATEENRLLSKLINRQLPNIAKRRDRHKHNAAVVKKAAAAQEDFTRRATALLNASTTHADTTHTHNNAHEDTEPNW
jgi:hypothetical protein